MSELIEVKLPKLGESILSATVVQWLKKEGDFIELDEPLLEVSTDKVNSEIPSPIAGVVDKIFVAEEEEVEIGAPLALISTDSSSPNEAPAATIRSQTPPPCPQSGKESVLSPAVLRLAQLEGVSIEELRQIKGSGEGGRITKKDLERFVQKESKSKPAVQEDRIKLSGMRKSIADNMVRSFYEAPHASLVAEADVTDVMQLIAREKMNFKQTHGVKLTITSFLVQALTKAVQQFPMLNASLVEETIVMKRYVNVGIAVNVEKGLMVPVIKNCHERNLVSLAEEVADLALKARAGKLSHDEIAEGTVTLTNFGMTGALIGVPIIRYPEVAIVGAGTIQKRVVVREDESLAVRQMIYLTLTFDHRVIDGIYGCQFLDAFKQNLESVSLH